MPDRLQVLKMSIGKERALLLLIFEPGSDLLVMRRLLIILCVVLPCVFVLLCILIYASIPDLCSDELVFTAVSNDDRYVVNVVSRDCGATTDFVNIVYLNKKSDSYGKGRNWGEKIYVLRGDVSIPLLWGNSKITIDAPASGENVFLKKDKWKDITINYGHVEKTPFR